MRTWVTGSGSAAVSAAATASRRRPGQQRPAGRGQHAGRSAVGRDHPEPHGLPQRPGDQLPRGGPRAPGPLPEQPVHQRLGRRRAAGGQVAELGQGVPAQPGDGPAGHLGRQRGDRPVAVVGQADAAGAPVGGQPRRGQLGPAPLGGLQAASGRRPASGARTRAQVGGQEPGGVGQLHVERRLLLRDVHRHGGAPQVPDADAAAAQHAGGRGGPGVQHLLDPAWHGGRRRGRGLVGLPRVMDRDRERRGGGREVAVQPGPEDVPAQEEGDLAREHDRVGAPAAEQAAGPAAIPAATPRRRAPRNVTSTVAPSTGSARSTTCAVSGPTRPNGGPQTSFSSTPSTPDGAAASRAFIRGGSSLRARIAATAGDRVRGRGQPEPAQHLLQPGRGGGAQRRGQRRAEPDRLLAEGLARVDQGPQRLCPGPTAGRRHGAGRSPRPGAGRPGGRPSSPAVEAAVTGSGETARAWRTWRPNASSRSMASPTEPRWEARSASAATEAGGGTARSGREASSAASRRGRPGAQLVGQGAAPRGAGPRRPVRPGSQGPQTRRTRARRRSARGSPASAEARGLCGRGMAWLRVGHHP